MVWIPYGDSGSLTSRFDSSDDSFGSVILLSAQTKTAVTISSADSSFFTPSVITLHSGTTPGSFVVDSASDITQFATQINTGGNFISALDSNSTVVPANLLDSGNVLPNLGSRFVADEPQAADAAASPTQVWIG